MKSMMTTALIALTSFLLGTASVHASTPSINLSIGGEVSPGVYGQIEIGNATRPPLLYAQPVIISRPGPAVVLRPVYLHVPPGHAKNWSKHCGKYNACGQSVYFVKSAEYESGYGQRGDSDRNGHGHGHGQGDHWEGHKSEHKGNGKGHKD